MDIDWTIEETVFSLLGEMGTISAVRLRCGNYALAINGECIRAVYWHAGQLDDCMAAAARMAGRDVGMPAPAASSPLPRE